MSITKSEGRQDIKIASVDFNYQDLGTAVQTNIPYPAIDLPKGAIVVGGALVVKTAWAGPTACAVDIGDSGLVTRYNTAVNLLAAGRTALVPTGYINAVDTVDLDYTSTVAAATAGAARLEVHYYVPARVESVFEN